MIRLGPGKAVRGGRPPRMRIWPQDKQPGNIMRSVKPAAGNAGKRSGGDGSNGCAEPCPKSLDGMPA